MLILNILDKNGKLNNKEIAHHRNKHNDTIHKQLLVGLKEGLIERNINIWSYQYNITDKGLDVLEPGRIS